MLLSWSLLVVAVLVLALAWSATLVRRRDLRRTRTVVRERGRAIARGSHEALLQRPVVDLSRCLGCGTCVRACPEEGVLALVHGQAQVVHGARCVGHARCAAECPTGAITVTLSDLSERRDIPALNEALEATTVDGLFLAGEVTGFALIRTAVTQGSAVAREVGRRVEALSEGRRHPPAGSDAPLDLVVVGAGPAGIACSLEAARLGLRFVTLEQETLGGTVSRYPRRKLVMTQPVELPLHGRLSNSTYEKEELMALWEDVVARNELPVRTGVRFQDLTRDVDGTLLVDTDQGPVRAHNVCLALGRRGTPRKLDVPGEELPKVAYALLDARSYTDRDVLVVGGGDSAIEAAVGLAEQPGNRVTLSYRKAAFFRLKPRNESLLGKAVAAGRVTLLLESDVVRIDEAAVELRQRDGEDGHRGVRLPNDEVFVFAGGIPPFQTLERAGVSFDPADRDDPAAPTERGTGLFRALTVALAATAATLAWVAWNGDYYTVRPSARVGTDAHELLAPTGAVGLGFGIAAVALIVTNLAYLLRRNVHAFCRLGALSTWLSVHVATGAGALLLALLHAGLAPEHTVGGHALAGLAILVASGAVGRYLYAFAPRRANGGELQLEEVQRELVALSGEWDRIDRDFGVQVRERVARLVERGRWDGSYVARLRSLVRAQVGFWRLLRVVRAEGRRRDLPADQLETIVGLARRAQRATLLVAHFEELRGILVTWRWIHRWVALSMVILVGAHVVVALRYARLFG